MRFDPSLRTCADFDLWLRLSDRPIRRIDSVLGSTRRSPSSMTCRPETYDQFCQDKLTALRRYFGRFASCSPLLALAQRAQAGVFLWAAESVLAIEGPSDRFKLYRDEAARLDPGAPRLRTLRVAALSHTSGADEAERTPVPRPRFSLARAKNALRGLTRSLL
jgi:hypothetical protein